MSLRVVTAREFYVIGEFFLHPAIIQRDGTDRLKSPCEELYVEHIHETPAQEVEPGFVSVAR